jgi:diketogulonate reductase-like aldo/keto reductase
MKITDKAKLNNGTEIPYLGFGTYQLLPDSKAKEAVLTAFEAGYRHIDTASVYGNEAGVGEAVRTSGIPRNEIFITTKAWNDEQGYDAAFRAFERSLNKLKTDYIDLYLIHWPVTNVRNDTWKALTEIVKEKACKAIGVSNFTIDHLQELFEISGVRPVVNQVEFNPFLYQKELLNFCRKNNIQLVAYTPIARNNKFNNTVLQKLSKKYSKTPAQVMLRWCLQHKLVVIPRSSNKNRIFENANVFDFELSGEDMKELNHLNEGYRTSADPAEYI